MFICLGEESSENTEGHVVNLGDQQEIIDDIEENLVNQLTNLVDQQQTREDELQESLENTDEQPANCKDQQQITADELDITISPSNLSHHVTVEPDGQCQLSSLSSQYDSKGKI